MKRQFQAALTAVILGVVGSTASAQLPAYQRPQTSPVNRPAVSPYLNILRGPGGYFQLTRPQMDANRNFTQLQYGLQGLQTQLDATSTLGGLPASAGTSGHPVAFFNYGNYYTFPFPRFGPTTAGGSMSPLGTPPGQGNQQNQLGAPPGGQGQRRGISPVIGVR